MPLASNKGIAMEAVALRKQRRALAHEAFPSDATPPLRLSPRLISVARFRRGLVFVQTLPAARSPANCVDAADCNLAAKLRSFVLHHSDW